MGILDQDPALDPEKFVFEEAFPRILLCKKLIKAYEEAVAQTSYRLLRKLIPEMDIHSAWDYDSQRSEQILSRNWKSILMTKNRPAFGGQKKSRLAKVLISNPDFLILDEPTNHLDIEMTEWLEESWVNRMPPLLMVTHDRYFLDRVCNQIIEIDEFGLFLIRVTMRTTWKREERIENRNAAIDKARNLLLYRTGMDAPDASGP